MAPATTTTMTKTPDLGTGVKAPQDFNNAGFMFLFAILGTAMVVASIYFFFVAKNGGFRWNGKKDWDDYKSTVLRRKGPNGTTLSNATKSTKLGGGSIVPKWAKTEYTRSSESSYDPKEMQEMEDGNAHGGRREQHRHASRHDPELQAYKHEKAAKVGGINTSHHGSQWDYTNTDRSVVSAPPVSKQEKQAAAKEEKERKRREKAEQKQQAKDQAAREKEEKRARKGKKAESTVGSEVSGPVRPDRAHRSYPSNAYSFQQGDDIASVYTATNTVTSAAPTRSSIRQTSYYEAYRPSSQVPPIREQPTPASSHHSDHRRSINSTPHRSSRDSLGQAPGSRHSPSHSRQGSPRKQHRSSRPASDYTASTADTGTKVYSHHIPGLSDREVGVNDSVSQVGSRQYRSQQVYPPQTSAPSSAGYRRGGRGRRDSLSDSEA
jgi:hypothetical protein